MKFIDWFAGIGGFRKGMELAGHECVGFCEFDKYAVMSYTAMHLCTQEQLEYLSTLPLKERQKEILKEEYRNGEWYADDVRRVYAGDIPRADCWCFGFPCQDISVSGKQLGFQGNRSSLFFRIMYLLGQLSEESKPTLLFVENVKNLLSVNGGWDFARLLAEMDRGGYDAEWQTLNSKHFGVPQNRERCFIIGHLRGRSAAEVFPVEGTNGADRIHRIGHRDVYRRNTQVFESDGITEALDTCTGGGRVNHTAIPVSYANGEIIKEIDTAQCLSAYGPAKEGVHTHQAMNRVIYELDKGYDRIAKVPYANGRLSSNTGVYDTENGVPAMKASQYKDAYRVAIPVITPEREKKRQNGRRFKEDGDESFTLTAQDRHGVAVDVTPQVIGGIGDKDFGKQWRQGNRIYDGDAIATAHEAHPVGNAGGNTNLYTVDMTGYNTTMNRGGGCDGHCDYIDGKGLQRNRQSDDDCGRDVFAIDKGITPKEREIANCIRAREDSGLTKIKQQGTLICMKVSKSE